MTAEVNFSLISSLIPLKRNGFPKCPNVAALSSPRQIGPFKYPLFFHNFSPIVGLMIKTRIIAGISGGHGPSDRHVPGLPRLGGLLLLSRF